MGCRQSKDKTEEEPKAEEGQQAGGEEDTAPKIVVVFGATGQQGGGVVRAMKDDAKYKVRAVTRNPDSEKAKALAESGVDVVKADLDDAESIKSALEGAYGVFLVTNFYETMDVDKETQQGKVVVDAAKAAGIKHFVFSGMEHVKELTGKTCAMFDGKGLVEQYIKEQELPFTSVRYSVFMSVLLQPGLKPKKNDDGDFVLNYPMGDVALHMLNVEDGGECVHQVFNNPEEYLGKTIGLSAEKLKVEEYAAILTKQLENKKFVAGSITIEDFAASEQPISSLLATMFEFFQTGIDRDVELTKKLNPNALSFEQWVEKNKEELQALE